MTTSEYIVSAQRCMDLIDRAPCELREMILDVAAQFLELAHRSMLPAPWQTAPSRYATQVRPPT